MKSLYLDTTTANRNPAARPDPCIVCIARLKPSRLRSRVNAASFGEARRSASGAKAARSVCPTYQPHVTNLPYLPRKAALRFSRQAAVPSFMSSVDATRPNSVASYWHASANGISPPLFTALMM